MARVEGLKEGFEAVYEGCKVIVPKEGRLLEMVHLAELNARQALDAHFMTARLEDDNLELLENLGKMLHIPTPYRTPIYKVPMQSARWFALLTENPRKGCIGNFICQMKTRAMIIILW